MKKFILFTIICFVSTIKSFSQSSGEKELGAWYMYAGSHKLSDKFSLATSTEFRTYEVFSNFNMLFLSAGASFKLNNNLSTGINYGYLHWDRSFESLDNANSNEHRFNEQMVLKSTLGKFKLNNRLRLEHRFINNYSSEETQHRLRYRFKFMHPINDDFFFSFFNEIMYNLKGFKFQQIRLYSAMGINLNKNSNLQIGYMKWSFKSRAFDRLQIGLYIKTDWSKKSKA